MSANATHLGPEHPSWPALRARRISLYARHEPVVLMRRDSPICRSEGRSPYAQLLLSAGGREIYATLDQIEGDLIAPDEVGLSEKAWALLGVNSGDLIEARHAPPLASLTSLRRRIYGMRLGDDAFLSIVADVAAGRYTDPHLAAFLTATSALPLDEAETLGLTRAMTSVGERLSWNAPVVMGKHCVGGLPGNRTSPIIVAIAAAAGLVMPKVSTRAITSPAGTADAMETLAPVNLDASTLRRVVEAEGGSVAWGGAMRLSPADDVLIRVERVLDVDTEGQLIASVLSKNLAAGVTHLVIDLPIGATAKVRSEEAALRISKCIAYVARCCGLEVACVPTDGGQPVGRGIGPALEALDVLAVLQGAPDAPQDLRRRACLLAGAAFELAGVAVDGKGFGAAEVILDDGRAWAKFQRICAAQGGLRAPPRAAHQESVPAAAAWTGDPDQQPQDRPIGQARGRAGRERGRTDARGPIGRRNRSGRSGRNAPRRNHGRARLRLGICARQPGHDSSRSMNRARLSESDRSQGVEDVLEIAKASR